MHDSVRCLDLFLEKRIVLTQATDISQVTRKIQIPLFCQADLHPAVQSH